MPVPTLSVSASPAAQSDADVVLLAARNGPDGLELLAADGFEWVSAALEALGAKGASDEVTRLPGIEGGPRVVAVAGVGDRADAPSFRLAIGGAVRQLNGADSVAIAIPTDDPETAAAILEGAALGAYTYSEYRSKPKTAVSAIPLQSQLDPEANRVDRVRAVTEAVARTKDLVNASPADLFPARLAELAVEAASSAGVAAKV